MWPLCQSRRSSTRCGAEIRFEQWERFPSASKLLNDGEWTDAALLESLRNLYAEAASEHPGQRGRDSNVFEFHDCGLMSIVEMLEKRTGSTR